jgi:acyl-CoA synthetase (AMP-forming)/AMP-acid ligase II
LLASSADRHGSKPALTFVSAGEGDDVTYTYDELFERAAKLAAELGNVYEDSSAPLGLLLRSHEDQILHYLAALSIGAVPAILTPPNRKLNRAYYLETMGEVLRRCQFGAIVSDVDGMNWSAKVLEPYTFDLRSPGVDGSGAPVDEAAVPLDASFMQFSSGTTGIKKGVLVTDDAVIRQLTTYGRALGLAEDDCVVSWLPLYHDMGFIACLNMPLAHGVHTVMIDPIDWISAPGTYLQTVSRYAGTLSWHPNFAYAFMAARVGDASMHGVDLSSLRGLVNCSEPVTHKSQQLFLERFAKWGLADGVFKGCYAMAETTFALTHGESDDLLTLDRRGPNHDTKVPRPVVSVGRPLPDVDLAVVDPESRAFLPEREVGEIWVRSPFNFFGYYKEGESTSEAFDDDWYRTGDLGYRIDDSFYVIGRSKDVLIVAGVNVFPQDIEEIVSDVEGVHAGRVSAFSAFDERVQTERVVILAESDDHYSDTSRRIAQEIRTRVLGSLQISNMEVCLVPPGWLVKSTSGKMARSANQRKWERHFVSSDQ